MRPAGPYFLLGHSLGAVFALEVARQLELAGEQVELVALVDSAFGPLPGYRPGPLTWLRDTTRRAAARLSGRPEHQVPPAVAEERVPAFSWIDLFGLLYDLAHEGRTDGYRVMARHARFGFASYFGLWQVHRCQVPVRTGASVLYIAKASRRDPRFEKWAEYLHGPWASIELGGDHMTILRDPNVAALAEDLQKRMADVSTVVRSLYEEKRPD